MDPAQGVDADWTSLPLDLLRRIFGALLLPAGLPLPLLPAARRWFAIRLTCRTWASALAGQQVSVDCCVPVPWVLPWLHAHVTALRLAPPPHLLSMPSSSWQDAFAWVQDRCGTLCVSGSDWAVDRESAQVAARIAYEEYVAKLGTGTTEHSREPCRAFRFQSSLFVPADTEWEYDGSYAAQPMLDLSALTRLRVLDIMCGYCGGGCFGTHTFDTTPLSRLPELHTLILRGFEEPCLWGLPRTLRVLRVLGGRHNDTRHNPVRYPRHHWALPAYCCLDELELVGYNREYRGPEAGGDAAAEAELGPHNVAQLFHAKRRFKVLLTNVCRQAARVRTDADVLHLGPPDPPLSTQRWLPPDHGLNVFLCEEEVEGVLAALEDALGPTPRLRELQLAARAWFVLQTGALVPVAALATPTGYSLMQQRWPAAEVQVAGGGVDSWLTVTWRPPY